MNQIITQTGAMPYHLGRYGMSRAAFRDARPLPDGPYIAFVGGAETFGRYLPQSLPQGVEALTGVHCVNFGIVNASIGAHLADGAVMTACHDAALTVLELTGAANLGNALYRVHPRRNDRIVCVSPLLREIYGEVDFADFVFTRHMLAALKQVCPKRFEIVRRELARAWVEQTAAFVAAQPGPVVLLWLSRRPPGQGPVEEVDPIFVSEAMLRAVLPGSGGLVAYTPAEDEWAAGRGGMVYFDHEEPAADLMVGAAAQAGVAARLAAKVAQAIPRAHAA